MIAHALGPVLADLSSHGGPLPSVADKPWQDVPGAESVMLYADDGSGMGVWLDTRLPEPERLAHLADQVQEWAIEELGRIGRPTNWPRCPAHPDTHPCRAEVRSGAAVWACPAGDGVAGPVGALG